MGEKKVELLLTAFSDKAIKSKTFKDRISLMLHGLFSVTFGYSVLPLRRESSHEYAP